MSKNETTKDGFYSKIFVATIVVIWVSLVGGNWLGHYAVEKGLLTKGNKDKQKSGEYRAMPNQRPKPWVTVDPKQVEAVEQLTGQHNAQPANTATPEESSTPIEVVTSTPIVQNTDPKPVKATPKATPKVTAASPTPIALETPDTAVTPPAPTPAAGDQKYSLQFGSFSSRDNAQRMADELTRVNQPATVEEIDAGRGKVYRVRGGAYSEEEARLQRDKLREQNIDAYIVNQ